MWKALLSVAASAVCLHAAGHDSTAPPVLPPKGLPPNLTIVIFDYAGVARPVLAAAAKEGREVLRGAGVASKWTICQVSTNPDQHCNLPPAGSYVQVKILPKSLEDRHPGHDGFGSATKCPAGEGCFTSWIFFHHLADFAARANQPVALALACVMTHEIGHLMGMDHNSEGLMKAQFDRHDLEAAAVGRLRFTSQDAHIFQASVTVWNGSVSGRVVAQTRAPQPIRH